MVRVKLGVRNEYFAYTPDTQICKEFLTGPGLIVIRRVRYFRIRNFNLTVTFVNIVNRLPHDQNYTDFPILLYCSSVLMEYNLVDTAVHINRVVNLNWKSRNKDSCVSFHLNVFRNRGSLLFVRVTPLLSVVNLETLEQRRWPIGLMHLV